MPRSKIEPGQAWKSNRKHQGYTFIITRVAASIAYCQTVPASGITIFANYLDKDSSIILGPEWHQVPNECACGIHRQDCDYHRL